MSNIPVAHETRSKPPSQAPRLEFVTCAGPAGLHRMAYWEWGDPDDENVLLCVHGLTRNGRDFDRLAQVMAREFRVVCPDVAGRGQSDWLIDPANYVVPQYVADMVTLIARLHPRRLAWVGTSMGGIIGLALAGAAIVSRTLRPGPEPWGLGPADDIPLTRMVLNDIGPDIDAHGLARIASYVGQPQQFKCLEDAIAYVKSVSAEFGSHDPQGWEDLTRFVFHERAGSWVKHYDLRLAQPFATQGPQEMAAAEDLLWQAWDGLTVPSLVLRGAQSDILSASSLQRMLRRNPLARGIEFPDVGHAPTLRSEDQISAVHDFLTAST